MNRFLLGSLVCLLLVGACSGEKGTRVSGSNPFGSSLRCLSGDDKSDKLEERPAIAVKVENNPAAYPLAGLEDAEVVYEEVVEGGITRFMAIYHCTDSPKVGPVRSSRTVDAAIMRPITRLLAAAGGNKVVRKHLSKSGIVILDEQTSGNALRRIQRPGLSVEHTLYGHTRRLRALGEERFNRPPPPTIFEFGDAPAQGKKVRSVTVTYSGAATVAYRWSGGKWKRFDDGQKLMAESGGQIAVDNVLVEEHRVNFSKKIVDAAGNPSIEIADPTGSGRALLFRDGQAFRGRWSRKSRKDPVSFELSSGEEMVLAPGATWISLVPDNKGQIKGSVRFK